MRGDAKMKKILFMLSSMNIGGVEKSLLSLLSEINREEYDITVLLLEKKGDFLEYIPEGVKVEEVNWFKDIKPIIMQPPQTTVKNYIKNKEFIKLLTFIYSYFISKYFNKRFLYYKNIFKIVPFNNNTYDIAISYHGPTDIIDYYIANKVKAPKKISWVHFDISKHKVNEKLYAELYNKFNKIFVVSNVAKQRLVEHIPSVRGKTEVFLNVIPTQLIKEMSKEVVKFDETYTGIKVVTVGRLSTEKGQDLAIKVLYRLIKNGYNVRWYCLGDGNSKKEYEILLNKLELKKDFLMLGSTPNPYPYIANADIYVQTSRHEGYCLTLAEAKCLNKPIITTNFTGAFEQLKDGYNGLIVEFCEEELYQKLKYLIDNPLERNRLSKNLENIYSTKKLVKLNIFK